MCRPAKIPAMTRGRGSKMGQGCRRRGVWMRCGGLRCGSAAPMAHCIAYCAKASQRKHWEPHPIDHPAARSTDIDHPFLPACIPWQLRSRFITCNRPLDPERRGTREICCFLGRLTASSHILILSSLSTSSSSPTRKALVLTPPAHPRATSRY